MQVGNAAALRLNAVVEADPGALVRVLQFFQARNLIPRTVASERLGDDYLQIQIELDPAELADDGFRIVVSKINELPIVLAAVACDGPVRGPSFVLRGRCRNPSYCIVLGS